MQRSARRLGGSTWLVAAVAVLLPLVAWLQYDWVTQLATADRERRERTLRSAAAQFTSAIDGELSRLGGSLQLDGAMVERQDWDAYALRYAAATASGAGQLVRGVWYARVDRGVEGSAPTIGLLRWAPESRAFEPAEWSADLTTVHAQIERHVASMRQTLAGGPRDFFASTAGLGDERTLVMPVLGVRDGESARLAPDVLVRGFTIVGLALEALTEERLPELVAEHFPDAEDYRLAIVTRDGERVVFESEPGAAEATKTAPDLTTAFLQPRVGPMMVVARTSDRRRGESRWTAPPPPPPPPPGPEVVDALRGAVGEATRIIELRGRDGGALVRAREGTHDHGHWMLRVRHRAGSLEAAVAASRRRNLILSGSMLALLGVATTLMAVSARRAQALARQQMEFVAAVSHELRTPVAVIQTAAGNLADGVVDDGAKVKRYGTTIQTEARRLGDTVERVLLLAGLGSGRTLPMAPVSAASVVSDAVQQSAADIARAGIDLRVNIASDVPALLGDAQSLASAVQNLVGNAVKYAGPDRWVGVRVFGASTAGRPEVHIAVEDHGAGLDADERAKVFEPFFRGRRAVADQIQGSGLGLSLVQRIAEAHGGRVDLETGPGGSTFTLRLPTAPPATGATATSSVTAPSTT